MDGRKTREARTRRQRAIRASDLARLVVCEQKVAFEDRYSERQDATSARSLDEGNRQHAAFLRQAFLVNPALKSSEAKPWCFLASEIYGGFAAEMEDLRIFRDRILRPFTVGRKLIRAYYRISPIVAAWLSRSPTQRAWMRVAMKPVVWAARRLLRHVDD
jgi:hypothetical protein